MSSPRRTGTIIALLLPLLSQSQQAAACVLEPLRLHHSDADLARIDTAPPERPVVLAAEAYRRSGLTCGQDICVANNCESAMFKTGFMNFTPFSANTSDSLVNAAFTVSGLAVTVGQAFDACRCTSFVGITSNIG